MISIIVNLYNMRREAARTLFTLSERYQRGVSATDYEVIVVENGSSEPVGAAFVHEFGRPFRYVDIGSQAQPSPAYAVNFAVEQARGEAIGLILDGARMVTPGMIHTALQGLSLGPQAFVCTLAWHLGKEHQSISVKNGYCQVQEDRLLDSVDWQADGYRLFDHAALAFSNPHGHFGLIAESCATFMRKDLFRRVGGYSERFRLPGGGYVNLDFFKRCCELSGVQVILLSGEGTFHQYHGGATTGAGAAEYGPKAAEEYRALQGHTYVAPELQPTLLGPLSPQAMKWLHHALAHRLS